MQTPMILIIKFYRSGFDMLPMVGKTIAPHASAEISNRTVQYK